MSIAERAASLTQSIREMGSVGVAFSGGVDSAVVAKAAFLACGDRATAFTAVSPSLAQGELPNAVHIAALIGIRHETIETEEFSNPKYVRNSPDRCYFCKSELYSQLVPRARALGISVLLNGANLDDRGDHRPGMKAAADFDVHSPLIKNELTKNDVRELAKWWGLPIWDKPASPCLSSRVAYGIQVTPERLRMIDEAEQYLRTHLSEPELRVRCEANDLARIEVPGDAIMQLASPDRRAAISKRLKEFGFRYVTVDLEGFRSGSLNLVMLDGEF